MTGSANAESPVFVDLAVFPERDLAGRRFPANSAEGDSGEPGEFDFSLLMGGAEQARLPPSRRAKCPLAAIYRKAAEAPEKKSKIF